MVIMLLKSWASPAARRPTASRSRACRRSSGGGAAGHMGKLYGKHEERPGRRPIDRTDPFSLARRFPAAATMDALPRIPGYELSQRLGGGPLTTVYAARDAATDQP